MKTDRNNMIAVPAMLKGDRAHCRAEDGRPCVYDNGPYCDCNFECPSKTEVWVENAKPQDDTDLENQDDQSEVEA